MERAFAGPRLLADRLGVDTLDAAALAAADPERAGRGLPRAAGAAPLPGLDGRPHPGAVPAAGRAVRRPRRGPVGRRPRRRHAAASGSASCPASARRSRGSSSPCSASSTASRRRAGARRPAPTARRGPAARSPTSPARSTLAEVRAFKQEQKAAAKARTSGLNGICIAHHRVARWGADPGDIVRGRRADRSAQGSRPVVRAPRSAEGRAWLRPSSTREKSGPSRSSSPRRNPAAATSTAARKKRYAITMAIRAASLVLAVCLLHVIPLWAVLTLAVLGTLPARLRRRHGQRPAAEEAPVGAARRARPDRQLENRARTASSTADAQRAPAAADDGRGQREAGVQRRGRRPARRASAASSPAANASPAPVVSTTRAGCAGRCSTSPPDAQSAPSAPGSPRPPGAGRPAPARPRSGVGAAGEQHRLLGVGQQHASRRRCRPATGRCRGHAAVRSRRGPPTPCTRPRVRRPAPPAPPAADPGRAARSPRGAGGRRR